MSVGIANSIRSALAAPPGFVLAWVSGAMKLYPWYLRLGLLLHRFVQ